jgi:hypothetical protein
VQDLALLLRDLSTLLDALDVISVGKHLTAFLICNGHVGHKSLDEGSFPDFFSVRKEFPICLFPSNNAYMVPSSSGLARALACFSSLNRSGRGEFQSNGRPPEAKANAIADDRRQPPTETRSTRTPAALLALCC